MFQTPWQPQLQHIITVLHAAPDAGHTQLLEAHLELGALDRPGQHRLASAIAILQVGGNDDEEGLANLVNPHEPVQGTHDVRFGQVTCQLCPQLVKTDRL